MSFDLAIETWLESLGLTQPLNPDAHYHPRAMPVIFRTSEQCDPWMTVRLGAAMELQRPLSDGVLHIVARGTPTDGGGEQSPAVEREPLLL